MKERITKFDMEAAFKALEDIEAPKVRGGIAPNRSLVETARPTKASDKSQLLVEDYYDINNTDDLEQAQAEREAEIAKAKLARIEKIVDLNAESEDDLLPSYVGKVIIQCPQCMTLFYKDEADIEPSEEDSEVVNVGEVCQHCGNADGYSLIGRVGEVKGEELAAFTGEEEAPAEEEPTDEFDLNIEETGEGEEEAEEKPEEEAELTIQETGEEEPTEDEEEKAGTIKDEEDEDKKKEESLKEGTGFGNYYAVIEVDGEERRFPFDTKEEAQAYIAKVRDGKAPEFEGKKIGSMFTESLEECDAKLVEGAEDDDSSWIEDTFTEDACVYINRYGFYDVYGSKQAKKVERILAAFPKFIAKKTKGKAIGKELEVEDIEDEDGLFAKRIKVKGMKIKESLELTEDTTKAFDQISFCLDDALRASQHGSRANVLIKNIKAGNGLNAAIMQWARKERIALKYIEGRATDIKDIPSIFDDGALTRPGSVLYLDLRDCDDHKTHKLIGGSLTNKLPETVLFIICAIGTTVLDTAYTSKFAYKVDYDGMLKESLTEDTKTDDRLPAVTASNIEGLMKDFDKEGTPSDAEIEALLGEACKDGKCDEGCEDGKCEDKDCEDGECKKDLLAESLDEIDEAAINKCIAESLNEEYKGLKEFILTKSYYYNNEFIFEGIARIAGPDIMPVRCTFSDIKKDNNTLIMTGLLEDRRVEKQAIILEGKIDSKKTFITESIKYNK